MAATPDVFVSYTQADRSWAEWIAWVLEEEGLATVLQAWDFAAGENFIARMQHASAEATRTIAVLSPDYVQSRYAEDEWTAALRDGTLLPVRVRAVDVRGVLGPPVATAQICTLSVRRGSAQGTFDRAWNSNGPRVLDAVKSATSEFGGHALDAIDWTDLRV